MDRLSAPIPTGSSKKRKERAAPAAPAVAPPPPPRAIFDNHHQKRIHIATPSTLSKTSTIFTSSQHHNQQHFKAPPLPSLQNLPSSSFPPDVTISTMHAPSSLTAANAGLAPASATIATPAADATERKENNDTPTLIFLTTYDDFDIPKFICAKYNQSEKVDIKWIILCTDKYNCKYEKIEDAKTYVKNTNPHVQDFEIEWFDAKFLTLPTDHPFSEQKKLMRLCERGNGLIISYMEYSEPFSDEQKRAIHAIVDESSTLDLILSLQKVVLFPLHRKKQINGIDRVIKDCMVQNDFSLVHVNKKVRCTFI